MRHVLSKHVIAAIPLCDRINLYMIVNLAHIGPANELLILPPVKGTISTFQTLM